jgi:SAM-dependent methyltransferase
MDKQTEIEKWDGIYAGISADQALTGKNIVYPEIADAIEVLMPAGARILEAACGSGLQSLELAKRQQFQLTLMDFSINALTCARQIFQKSGVSAEFQVADIFTPPAIQPFDLVYNAGVLEHYEFSRQVEFLQGMAKLSSRYLLVLVPNRDCYWYWIYRIQKAASGQWSFGYERPAGSYAAAIQAAGLHFLGQRFFAADAVAWAISNIDGLQEELRQLILGIHQHQVVPEAQRCYLTGFLAARDPGEVCPEGWIQSTLSRQQPCASSEWPAASVALAADALAVQLGALHQLQAEQLQRENLCRQMETLSARIEALGK